MMKRKLNYSAAAIVLAFWGAISCSKTDTSASLDETQLVITASFAESDNTKTTLQSTGTVYWETEDEVKIFYGSSTGRLVSTNNEIAQTTTFTGSINTFIGTDEGFAGGEHMWGLYPYRSDATYDGTYITTTLPNQQTGRAGSFAKNTNISIAESTNMALSFYNVCGGLRFSLTRNDVTDVVLEGRNNEDIAGTISISFVNGVPAIHNLTDGQKKITLKAPSNGTFEAGKWYYIVAIPGTLNSGFKLTLNTATKYAEFVYDKSITVQRKIFLSKADADNGLSFSDKTLPSGIITFEDNAAEYACLAKFDTNNDGQLSYSEASVVTDISGLFTNYNTVVKFNELQYFTSLTTIGTALSNLQHLEEVTLPSGITSIPAQAFNLCSALKSVTIQSGTLTSIGDYAFQNCSALTSLDFTSSLTDIGAWAFYYCTSLTHVTFPQTLKTIGQSAFCCCYSLAAADLPSSLTAIGGDAFCNCKSITTITIPNSTILTGGICSGCQSLQSATLPSSMTTIPDAMFNGCYQLCNFTFPSNLETIGARAFYDCPLYTNGVSKVTIPATVVQIGADNFNRLRNVYFLSDAMITVSNDDTFGPHTKIWVNPSIVDQCKAQSEWSVYANHIFSRDAYSDDVAPEGTVDMGTSVFWATMNLGATTPEEYGDYYAWGEVEPYYTSQNPLEWKSGKSSGYDWPSYKYCNGTNTSITKYNRLSSYGTVDNKKVLDLSDDAAYVSKGGKFCIASISAWEELQRGCIWTYTQMSGTNGWHVYSSITGNSIFLPISGFYQETYKTYIGSIAHYWSSNLFIDNCDRANAFNLTKYINEHGQIICDRCVGNVIRPISE